MALNWSLVVFFLLGLTWTFSNVIKTYRHVTGYEDSNLTQIISEYGYQSENHTVLTEDGYLLTIFRITQSRNCTGGKIKSPVLLMNGLLATADSFLDAGVDAALPFLISDSCYDIWLGNVRGTYYGRRHVSLNPDSDKQFWDFTVDEIGLFDVPAIIDYVLNNTGVEQLNYIGVSQGAGTFFIMCSERPGYCDKTRVLIGLAPAARHLFAKSQLFRLFMKTVLDYEDFLQSFGIWEFMWKGFLDVVRVGCQYRPYLCEALISVLDAPHPGSVSTESLKTLLNHFPAGTSVKNLARYGQSLNSVKYRKFDYGPEKNMKVYGGEPPEYNLSAVNVPTVLLHGINDGIVDIKDTEWLVSKLPNVQEFMIIENPLWNHMDMVAGKDIPNVVFPKVLEYLQLYNGNETLAGK